MNEALFDLPVGTAIYNLKGQIQELHRWVKLGDKVFWLGRKEGSGSWDDSFKVGEAYEVIFIYPAGGVELQGPEPQITTRAGASEFETRSRKHPRF